MANLKYRDRNGVIHTISPYQIQNIIVSQKKGDSTADVMSQHAVTELIEELEDKIITLGENTNDTFGNYYAKDEIDLQLTNLQQTISQEISEQFTTENERALEAEQTLQDNIDNLRTDSEAAVNEVEGALNSYKDEVSNLIQALQKQIDDLNELLKWYDDQN